MPKLIVQLKQNTIQELELTGERVVIGRSEDSAVRLDDDFISREHAEIREENGRYLVSDLGSANGTCVGTRPITRDYELKDGDVIRIGLYTISFRIAAHERPTQVGMVGSIQTGEKATEVFTFSGTPRLLVRSGAEVGKSYDLTNNPLIGRGEDSDIVLDEGSVSRKHARIQFIENRLTIVDVGSRSGTRVNGKLIDKPTPLKDGDRVQLGEASLEIEWKGGSGAPKAEAEKATVPFFRPDLASAKKEGQWWKWAVGIAAGLIVVIGVYLAFFRYPSVNPYLNPNRLASDAEVFFKQGSDSGDSCKLDTALAKIDSALASRAAGEKEKKLKQDIEREIDNFKYARDLAVQAGKVRDDGDLGKAKELAELAYEKAPTVPEVKKIWNELKPAPSKGGGGGVTVPPPPIPYDKAVEAYRDGNLTEADSMVAAILQKPGGDSRANGLKGRIDLWKEGRYLKGVVDDPQAAAKTYEELLRNDPGNSLARAELSALTVWNGQEAESLFNATEADYRAGVDNGVDESKAKAKAVYEKVVSMGTPPDGAPQKDKDIYSEVQRRLEILK